METDDEDKDLPALIPRQEHGESDDEDKDLKDFIVDDSDIKDIESEEILRKRNIVWRKS